MNISNCSACKEYHEDVKLIELDEAWEFNDIVYTHKFHCDKTDLYVYVAHIEC